MHSITFPCFAIFLCSQHVSVVEREREGTKKAAAPKDKSLPLASRSSSQRPRAHTCELAQVDERPYRALPFTAARVLSVFHRCDGGAEFRKSHSKKTPDVLPDLNRRCFQEGHGRPRPACVIRDRDVGRRAASIPVRALLWFFRSISPQRARPAHRPRRRRNEHARPI